MFTTLIALLLAAGLAIAEDLAYPESLPDRASLEARFGPPDSDTPLEQGRDQGRELRWIAWATEIRDAGRGTPTVAGDGTGVYAVPGTYQAPQMLRHRCDISAIVAPDGAVRDFQARGFGCAMVMSRLPDTDQDPDLRQR